MTRLELLAPAKNLHCGIAAIDHGADAVYIGAQHFGARAAAGNSIADINSLCQYAHQFGARVYVTVNTLIYDNELEEVRQLFHQLADISVDAVLIQDMRLLSLAKDIPLCFHASTQADNRTAEKVEWLHQRGFSRAVLARELSVKEVAAIHRQVPQMELEVFVHGALCVSYSGLCFASEHCFHRSANRGECAQFCRMAFDLLDADGQELLHQRHLLSLKDLNLSAHLDQLIEAGAVSFKIEGRLKDISYVKNVTAAYSQLLDKYIAHHPGQYERSSQGHCRYTFQPDLRRTFNRGYTSYFLSGRQPAMASFYTPKAIGQYVGKVKEIRGASFTVAGTASFVNGDGLCFFGTDGQLAGFRINRVEGNHLIPLSMPHGLQSGTSLYRSNDQAMEQLLNRPSSERKIPIRISLSVLADDCVTEGFMLRVADDRGPLGTFTFHEAHQLANTPQHENIVRQLSKLGNTPFTCTQVELPADFNYFIPSSLLTEWRRQMVKQLQSAYVPPRKVQTIIPDNSRASCNQETPLMQCRYCLRYELGCCVRHGGKHPSWREPLFLRMSDGRRFRLEFDCSKCQMNVHADAK